MSGRALPLAAAAAALLLLGWAALAGAQGGSSATASAATEHGGPPAVGDEIVITITASHPAGAEAVLAGSAVLDPLDPALARIERRSPTETRITLRTRAFQTGAFEVALPDVLVSSGGGRETIPLDSLRIEIISLLDGETGLRPNAPPAAGDQRGFAPWLAGLIALGAAFAITTALRALLRKRAPPRTAPAEQPQEPARPPELPQPDGDAETFCRELSARVRAHLAQAWRVPAASLTPAELQAALAEAGAPRAMIERARTLIAECDEARFSGDPPPTARLRRYRDLAEAIIAEDAVA